MNAYSQFLQRINVLSERLGNYYAKHLVCRAGCSGCCQHHLSVFPLEAQAAAQAIHSLPSELRQQLVVQANDVIAKERRAEAVACPMLVNDKCAIYEARPVICRTQGLPLLFEAEDGAAEVDFCPLNFTAPEALNELTEDALVPLDEINLQLAYLNLQHCRATGLSDAESGRRVSMSEVILNTMESERAPVAADVHANQ